MIALTFEFQAIWLRQNCANLVFFEVAYVRYGCLFGRYAQDRGTLCSANGSRSATNLKKLCSADKRQFRVPIEDL